MKIPELTPQRQKMLMGAAAAGLLLVLGFSFAPTLDVADETGDEVDEVLAIVVDERGPQTAVEKTVEPRPLRRIRSQKTDERTSSTRIEQSPEMTPIARNVDEPKAAERAQVIPPAYQQRLELLAEEEAALLRHQRRRADTSAAQPMPTVTVASVETVEGKSNDVEHALAEARRPDRWRRVELIEGTAGRSATPGAQPRGAWLSGSIESD